jgi:hypothetical protein
MVQTNLQHRENKLYQTHDIQYSFATPAGGAFLQGVDTDLTMLGDRNDSHDAVQQTLTCPKTYVEIHTRASARARDAPIHSITHSLSLSLSEALSERERLRRESVCIATRLESAQLLPVPFALKKREEKASSRTETETNCYQHDAIRLRKATPTPALCDQVSISVRQIQQGAILKSVADPRANAEFVQRLAHQD